MKTSIAIIATALALLSKSEAFQSSGLPAVRQSQSTVYGYVPSGFTKEQYEKFKKEEAKKNATKNLGGVGPRGFKSRSFQSFQEALERGEATHLLPVFDAKGKLARGEIKEEDIPYMQRGGSWDNSDVKGAKKVNWLKSDKDYANGGYLRDQNFILGLGGVNWTGKNEQRGPQQPAPKVSKNYKAPSVDDLKKSKGETKKKLFGLF